MLLGYSFVFGRRRLRFAAIALLLTLLQRPYLFNIHWIVPVCVVSTVLFRDSFQRQLRFGSNS